MFSSGIVPLSDMMEVEQQYWHQSPSSIIHLCCKCCVKFEDFLFSDLHAEAPGPDSVLHCPRYGWERTAFPVCPGGKTNIYLDISLFQPAKSLCCGWSPSLSFLLGAQACFLSFHPTGAVPRTSQIPTKKTRRVKPRMAGKIKLIRCRKKALAEKCFHCSHEMKIKENQYVVLVFFTKMVALSPYMNLPFASSALLCFLTMQTNQPQMESAVHWWFTSCCFRGAACRGVLGAAWSCLIGDSPLWLQPGITSSLQYIWSCCLTMKLSIIWIYFSTIHLLSLHTFYASCGIDLTHKPGIPAVKPYSCWFNLC